MEPGSYLPAFVIVTSLIAFVMAWNMSLSPGDEVCTVDRRKNFIYCIGIGIVLIFWIGGRPVSAVFGDTINYAMGYATDTTTLAERSLSSEWLFNWLTYFCQQAGLDVHAYFTIIEAVYIITLLLAVLEFAPRNPLLAMMFALCSPMFFSFGVNGLRNGMACHILLLAFARLLDDRFITAAILAFAAFSIHRSVILPAASIVAARWVVKKPEYGLYIWLASIALSLVAGGWFIAFFASLGFDDRMDQYAQIANDQFYQAQFSSIGFRWDFLLYSSAPIVMGYIVLIKKEIRENWYRILYVTYCLANAFWVLVIRAAFSNRFAYLSWFMYWIVIVYPLIMIRIWPEQDRKTAIILTAYASFSLVMNLFYW